MQATSDEAHHARKAERDGTTMLMPPGAGMMSAVFQINFGLQGPGRAQVTTTKLAA